MNARILIVEDDANVALVLRDTLTGEGYLVTHACDGKRAMEQAAGQDLILLDVGLPGKDGFSVCDELRRKGVETPILLLTARGEPEDKVRGLRMGADDYVTKPFHVPELLARIAALLRRARRTDSQIVLESTFGNVEVNFYKGIVRKNGRPVELTGKELTLLRHLIARRAEVVTREELLAEVWGYQSTQTRTVDVHVATLRQKLEDDPHLPAHILTVRGEGYRFRGD